MSEYNKCDCEKDKKIQRHVHEILGSVLVAERKEDAHAHRFAGVSGEAIPLPNGDHVHKIKIRTDFYGDHYHEICGVSSGAIKVGDRHVHFVKAATTVDDGHCHKFRVASLIEDPTSKDKRY